MYQLTATVQYVLLWLTQSLTSQTEHLFNLRFAAKELQRNSKKCDKEEKAEKCKVKQVVPLRNGQITQYVYI